MQTLSIRVPDDVEEAVEDLADANDNTRSDQARQLLRAGLEDHNRGDSIPTGAFLSFLGAFLFAGSAVTIQPAGPISALGLALVVGGVLLDHSKVRATARRVRDRAQAAVSGQ
jgi:hypothetical protein